MEKIFTDIPEVEELQLLLKLADWFNEKSASDDGAERNRLKLIYLTAMLTLPRASVMLPLTYYTIPFKAFLRL